MNKYIAPLLLFCILVSSCNKEYTHHPVILKAESIMTDSPKEATKLLETIPNPEKLPSVDYAAWCLQYIRSLNKQDAPIKSDSLIRVAVNYYKGTAMHKQAGTSYYLLGCIYENRQETQLAMREFKRAESEFRQINAYNQLALVYYHFGFLYSEDEYIEKALQNFKLSQQYFHRAKNYNNEAYAYREMAICMNNTGQSIDYVMYLYKKAQKLAEEAKDTVNYMDITASLANTLITKTFQYSTAKKYLLHAYKYYDESPYYYNMLAMAYSKLNRPDSAQYYFQKALPDTITLKSKVATFLAGAYVEKAKGNYIKALNYCLRYDESRNLFIAKTRQAQLYRIDKQYTVNKKNIENAQLKITNRNMTIYVGLMIVLVLLAIVFLLSIQKKRKAEQINHQLERERLLSEIEKRRLALFAKLQSRIESTIRFEELKLRLPKDSGLKSSCMDEMLEQFVLTEVEWQSYIDEVNLIFNNFIEKLSLHFTSITIADKIVIALVALQLDITSTCSILGINKNTMYRRRNTIKERLSLDKSVDLEEWLLEKVSHETI
jgi:tetratricopeptide (TPR) repeat protein